MYGHSYLVTRFLSDGTIELSRVKAGYFSGNDLENQVHQSYARSLTPLVIYDYVPSHNPKWAETTIHIALNKWRLNSRNEIFDLSSQEARDTFIEVKNFIVHLTEISLLPIPVKRKINYTYWSIAKQAAREGRKWGTRYLEKQILEDKKQKKVMKKIKIEKEKQEEIARLQKIEQEKSKKPKNKKERHKLEKLNAVLKWKNNNLVETDPDDSILYNDVYENYNKFFGDKTTTTKFSRNLTLAKIEWKKKGGNIKKIYGFKLII